MKFPRRVFLFLGAAAAALAALAAVWFVIRNEPPPQMSAETVRQGRALYGEHCASCHGADLEGEPDWRVRGPGGLLPAPPHDETGHTWHHADKQLFLMTKEGVEAVAPPGYQSNMLGFGDVMTDNEIWAVLTYIKSTWPERERAYQARAGGQ